MSFTLELAHKVQQLAVTLSQKLILALTLTKLVLILKISTLRTLVGLEMFFNVYGVSLNSSNLQMTGAWHIYIGDQVHRAVASHYAFFCVVIG